MIFFVMLRDALQIAVDERARSQLSIPHAHGERVNGRVGEFERVGRIHMQAGMKEYIVAAAFHAVDRVCLNYRG
jgi:hypothetical protein